MRLYCVTESTHNKLHLSTKPIMSPLVTFHNTLIKGEHYDGLQSLRETLRNKEKQ